MNMGIFDTVYFDEPRRCNQCGATIDQVQTKVFEPGLREYRVGDAITGSPVLNGVVREDLFCLSCNANSQHIYFAVWHTVLVGVFDDPERAQTRTGSVDRAELVDYLVAHQQQALRWHDRFSRLYGELQNLHDYQSAAQRGDASLSADSPRYFRIREIVATDDPLGELIRANKPLNPEDEAEVARDEETG
jgi:hypothetical protein